METTTIENSVVIDSQIKDEKTYALICYLKLQLKNYMHVSRTIFNKNSKLDAAQRAQIVNDYPYDFSDPKTLTLIHIIYNRLRRGNRRPHLESVEGEEQFIKDNKYHYDSLIKKLNQKGYEVIL